MPVDGLCPECGTFIGSEQWNDCPECGAILDDEDREWLMGGSHGALLAVRATAVRLRLLLHGYRAVYATVAIS